MKHNVIKIVIHGFRIDAAYGIIGGIAGGVGIEPARHINFYRFRVYNCGVVNGRGNVEGVVILLKNIKLERELSRASFVEFKRRHNIFRYRRRRHFGYINCLAVNAPRPGCTTLDFYGCDLVFLERNLRSAKHFGNAIVPEYKAQGFIIGFETRADRHTTKILISRIAAVGYQIKLKIVDRRIVITANNRNLPGGIAVFRDVTSNGSANYTRAIDRGSVLDIAIDRCKIRFLLPPGSHVAKIVVKIIAVLLRGSRCHP